MKRGKQSSIILHTFNNENKADSWDGLIFAAKSELERIADRANKLREAINVFERKKCEGDPLVQDCSRQEKSSTVEPAALVQAD